MYCSFDYHAAISTLVKHHIENIFVIFLHFDIKEHQFYNVANDDMMIHCNSVLNKFLDFKTTIWLQKRFDK